MSADRHFDAVVVGAGFAGMYTLHRLRELGFSAKVFEAGDDVGGTWYWNRYPGARCDIESLDYSYSFDHELEQEWEWTERYAAQPEILRVRQPRRRSLRPPPRHPVRHAASQRRRGTRRPGRWTIATDPRGDDGLGAVLHHGRGLPVASRSCRTSRASRRFAGPTYHTGHWPHEGVDFTGQRVGVIGTGSSAIQSIPLIAEQAAHLTVFQRTPNFSMPALNAALRPRRRDGREGDLRGAPRARPRCSRAGVSRRRADALAAGASRRGARAALPSAAGTQGTLVGIARQFADLLIDNEANEHRRRVHPRPDPRNRQGSRTSPKRCCPARPPVRAPSGRASTLATTRPTTATT